MIRHDMELQVTLERIGRVQQQVALLRRSEINPIKLLPVGRRILGRDRWDEPRGARISLVLSE
jgi:hypothetical protein